MYMIQKLIFKIFDVKYICNAKYAYCSLNIVQRYFLFLSFQTIFLTLKNYI